MFKMMIGAAIMLLSTCALAQDYTLRGSVRSEKTKEPLAGATVKLEGTSSYSISGESGQFEFRNLTSGSYSISLSFVGFETKNEVLMLKGDTSITLFLNELTRITDEVVVTATRAQSETPIAFTNVDKEVLQGQNFGQDLPFLLNWTPSLVTTSDAGAGVGYTGLRIRGSDATRINVTINGIPYNDSESQGTFWVNIPDIASSTQSVQIQRGVGTSSNGAGSFGGSVNLQTLSSQRDAYAEITGGLGSFNTQRLTLQSGTGLINNRWSLDTRLSSITSDGYIDRATSHLKSYYVSGGYHGDKTLIKAVVFGGGERTYQAWYGVDKETMKSSRTFNYAGAIYDQAGNIIDYYDNEVDDYKQDHYQLHASHNVNTHLTANVAFHYTYGRGFFEQYKQGESFADLGLENFEREGQTIESGDVIVRRWLDNHFYGGTYSLNYRKDKIDLTVGGAYNEYARARHFGEIIWAQYTENLDNNRYVNTPFRYYDGVSQKNDFNLYSKLNFEVVTGLTAFVDLQYRNVYYRTAGKDNDQTDYYFKDRFRFFNPKAGLSYELTSADLIFASYAVAHREPNRTDFLDNTGVLPTAERLQDVELGWRRNTPSYHLETNVYYMFYTDQLILTGALDDVGNPIRANVGKSYRAGIEITGGIRLAKNINWNTTVTFSDNRNLDFVVDETTLKKKDTQIILSPSVSAGSQLLWSHKGFSTALLSKYVSKQYLDNTENETFTLKPYLINDVRIGYSIPFKNVKAFELNLLVNNVLDVDYASNGAVYGIAYYYPQAGRNFMAMLRVRI